MFEINFFRGYIPSPIMFEVVAVILYHDYFGLVGFSERCDFIDSL